MTNLSAKATTYRNRLIRIEIERLKRMEPVLECVEDAKEVMFEIKREKLEKHEVVGIKMSVKEYFEDPAKKELRENAVAFKESLGDFANEPLGMAAIERHAADERVAV